MIINNDNLIIHLEFEGNNHILSANQSNKYNVSKDFNTTK